MKKLPTKFNYSDAICAECARAHGGRWPKGHCATQWRGLCAGCGLLKTCCAVGDWLWKNAETKVPFERWD